MRLELVGHASMHAAVRRAVSITESYDPVETLWGEGYLESMDADAEGWITRTHSY